MTARLPLDLDLDLDLEPGAYRLEGLRALAPEGVGVLRRVVPGEDHVAVETEIENRSGAPVRLDRVCPIVLEPAPFLAGGRALRVGYSNAIPPLPIGAGDREDRAITHPLLLRLMPRALAAMGFDPDGMPSREPGRVTSAWFTVLRRDHGGPALAIGLGGFRAQMGRVRLSLSRRAPSLRVELSLDGRTLAPGERLALEPVLLAAGTDPHEALARYARAAGIRAGARPRRLSYWCTWYAAPCDRIDEAFVASSAAALARRRAPLEFVVVDDGWQRSIGDWGATNAKFPRGLAALAAGIRAHGFRPGLWLAPFAVSPRSRLYAEHPDWVVRRADGVPLTAGVIAGLTHLPRRYFALDATRPEVRAHLERLLGGLRAAGFDLFKIDFLTAGAVAGVRADPGRTRAEAYAAGLGAIRRGVGEDAALLGAIAPWGLNVGFVDAQRTGADVAFGRPRWTTPFARLLGDWTAPSVHNALPAPLALAALDGAFFAQDGDAVVARGLPEGLARALARMSLACSSATAVGDDPRPGGRDALAILVDEGFGGAGGAGRETRILDLLDREIPERLEVSAPGAEPRLIELPWARLARMSRGHVRVVH